MPKFTKTQRSPEVFKPNYNRALIQRPNDANLVEIARTQSVRALNVLLKLMNGNGGTRDHVKPDGSVVEVRVEVPPAVQAKCAEIIIERGNGKVAQNLQLTADQGLLGVAERQLSVAEKILALRQREADKDGVIDLEASQQGDPRVVEALPAPTASPSHELI